MIKFIYEVVVVSNLIKFLTSKDVIIIYVIAGVLLAICLIVYLISRTREKRRLRNNTRELNKLVEIKKERSKPFLFLSKNYLLKVFYATKI